MTVQEKAKLALKCVEKGWDCETLKYSDDLYGQEDEADDIWGLVESAKLHGTKFFRFIFGL